MSKVKDLEAAISELTAEKEHLDRKLRLLGAGKAKSLFSIPDTLAPPPKSISGLENMYLQVDRRGVVENCNTKLAELLGKTKETVIGSTVAVIDTLPWAQGVFETLICESQLAGDRIDFETSFIDAVSGTERFLLFHALATEEQSTVTISETTRYHHILETFQRYVSPAVVEKLQNSAQDIFQTERAVLTVLFADLRGFTKLSSNLTPDEVKNCINEYAAAMIHTIDQYEGTVDKLIGDGVMAIFGAPIFYRDHAVRAIKVAIEMQRTHQRLLSKWKSDGKPAPPVGIGINTGDMVVGNIGCDMRMDYTVIGHNVNIAARLCGAAEGGEILVTERTCDALAHFVKSFPEEMRSKINFKKTGTIRVKGIDEEIPVAKVLY
jgi:class 3 adenylate cyclase